MELVRALKLQSGDDESITINISTECVPMDLSAYDAYWELRKTMTSEPVITKTSAGGGTDVVITTVPPSVTVYMSAMDTSSIFGEYLQYLYLINKTTYKKTSIIYGPVIFLEGFDTEYPTTTYCTPEDISAQLGMLNADGSRMVYTESTNPRRSDVIEFIREAETQIDRDTKNSWREASVIEEYHDIKPPLPGLPTKDTTFCLMYSHIRTIDPTKDKIEFWDGGTWVDYAQTAQSWDTWWVDYDSGIIHICNFWPWMNIGNNRIRCTYRWGYTEVPEDVKQACVKLVTIRLLQSDFNKIYIMNQRPNVDWSAVIESWTEDIKLILNARRRKIFAFTMR